MSDLYVTGMPGVSTERLVSFKRVFRGAYEAWLPGGKQIDGNFSRDPTNAGNLAVLQPGLVMGRIGAAGGAYAPSIYGVLNGAITGTGVTVTSLAPTITEIVRRKGATGTFKITGPPTAAGVVRQLTATYSATGATTATITALGVNDVQTLNFANSPAGTFTLTVVDLNGLPTTTPPITYSATIATLLTNINNALNTALGSSLVVATGTLVTAVALTFSGAGYLGLPQPLVVVGTNELTGGTVSVSHTTVGVNGAFVTGSFIQPVDGSENPLTFIGETDGGVLVTDMFGANIVVPFHRLPIAGVVEAAQLVNWPADTSLQAWLMGQLSTATGGRFTWDVNY